MGRRTVVSHNLADLKMAHGFNKDLPEYQYDQKSGYRPSNGTKGYVAEDIQAAQTGMQWIKKVVQHKKSDSQLNGLTTVIQDVNYNIPSIKNQ
jgi:hypothetical protein